MIKKILIAMMCVMLSGSYAFAFTIEDIDSEEIFNPSFIEKDKAAYEKEQAQKPQSPQFPAFTDVPKSEYYYEPVMWAVKQEVTAGTTATTFSPNQTCTNAQILTFVWRANGCPEPSISNPFTNLDTNQYYAKAAIWAYENKMISGNTFDANKPCTRAMTVEYFWKQAGSPSTALYDKFTDVKSNASYAQAVAWAVNNGVTAGTSDTTFSPSQTCTRGQIVTFLYRAIVQ